MSRWYEVTLDPDDNDTFFVTVPAFPEISTFGVNLEQARRNGLDAIEEAIAARIAAGDDLPGPARPDEDMRMRGNFVQIPLLVFLKCGLYMRGRAKGITRAELARRMGVHREQVDRLFRIDHNSRLDQIEAAFEAIGEPLDVDLSFEKAA